MLAHQKDMNHLVRMNGEVIEEIKELKYLGSAVFPGFDVLVSLPVVASIFTTEL